MATMILQYTIHISIHDTRVQIVEPTFLVIAFVCNIGMCEASGNLIMTIIYAYVSLQLDSYITALLYTAKL